MTLSPSEHEFILHWGEMGSRWGVNRSVAQVHALLYLSEDALAADEIAERLSMARSNVSTSLKELQGWRLIETARVLGDRRERFTAIKDGIEMAKRIVEGRRQREFLPTLTVLDDLVAQAESDPATPRSSVARMQETRVLMRLMDDWYGEMKALPTATQRTLLALGAKIARFLPKSGAE